MSNFYLQMYNVSSVPKKKTCYKFRVNPNQKNWLRQTFKEFKVDIKTSSNHLQAISTNQNQFGR